MPRKCYGKPYTTRHIRRQISERRASIMKDVNAQFLQYLDLACQTFENDCEENEEHNKNVNNTDTYADDMNFEACINICTQKDNTASLYCKQLSVEKFNEYDVCSQKSHNVHNSNTLSTGINEMQQSDFGESAKERTEAKMHSVDPFMLFLQNINDSEISSDSESDSQETDSLSDNNGKDAKFVDSLRNFCLKYIHTIPHVAVNDLLHILRENTNTYFPKDARSLLKTPRFTELHQMNNGQYCHYGLKRAITIFVLNFIEKNINVDSIQLLVNIDGAPLATSSEKGLWIISCSETVLNDVELVGIYHGEDKPPDSNTLVKMFVDELILLCNHGFECDSKVYKITLRALICDAPAKAYILKVKYHTGYCSCTKCQKEGEWLNKICFPGDIATLRTDQDFRDYKYVDEEYQRERTILADIPNFGLVTNVPLDYMHLVCLGVTLKLIEQWISGRSKVKLSEYQRKMISDRLVNLQKYMPSDFSRKPRKFQNVRRLWKAHELRQFLLYSGPVVLYNILDENAYFNFLLLHVAISILVNPILSSNDCYLHYAEQLLTNFVKSFQVLYGANNVTHNVHNLLHVVGDVREYGCLDSFSAFRFENHIRKIKQLVRKGDKPLQQIHRRLGEIVACKTYSVDINNKTSVLSKNYYNGPILPSHSRDNQFQIFRKSSLYLNIADSKSNCVLLKNGMVVECLNFVENIDKNQFIMGKPLETIDNFYSYPLDSRTLNIKVVKYSNENLQSYSCGSILAKLCKLPYNENFVVFPLIHTYNFEAN